MTNTVTLIAPSGVGSFQARSGTQYTVSANGTVTVNAGDVIDAVNGGFTISNLPAALQTIFGAGANAFSEEGNLYRAAYSAASALQPAATGADNVLAVYSVPANSFDVAGRGISITAQGLFANNSHTKDVKVIFNPSTAVVGSTVGSGGTTIADSGSSTAANVGFSMNTDVFKFGGAGSNTQYAQETGTIVGTTHGGCGAPQFPTATEAGAILVAFTGNAGTATTDLSLNFIQINATN
jgi:hypothetical protein